MIPPTIWLSLIHMANNTYVFEYHKHIFCLVWFICISNFIHVVKVHPFIFISPTRSIVWWVCSMHIILSFYNTINLYENFIKKKWFHSCGYISFIYVQLYFCDQFHAWIKASFIWYISFWCLFKVCFVDVVKFQLFDNLDFFLRLPSLFPTSVFLSPSPFHFLFISSTLVTYLEKL